MNLKFAEEEKTPETIFGMAPDFDVGRVKTFGSDTSKILTDETTKPD